MQRSAPIKRRPCSGRGNLADYLKAAQLYQQVAEGRNDPSARVAAAAVGAAVEVEFGEEKPHWITDGSQDGSVAAREAEIVSLFVGGKIVQANGVATRAIKRFPKAARLHYLMGRITQRRELPTARSHFERAVALDGSDATFLRGLGDAWLLDQQFERAQQTYERALRINRAHVGSLLGLVEYGMGRGKIGEVYQILRHVLYGKHRSHMSSGERARGLLLLVLVKVRFGDTSVRRLIDAAKKEGTAPWRDPRVTVLAARSWLALDKPQEAVQALDAAGKPAVDRADSLLIRSRGAAAHGAYD